MKKMYISYIEKNRNTSALSSMILAEFDANKLSEEDKESLSDCLKSGKCIHYLESVVPAYIYIAFDNIEDPAYIKVDALYNESEEWPVDAENVYTTLSKAKSAFVRESETNIEDYKKAAIVLILESLQ